MAYIIVQLILDGKGQYGPTVEVCVNPYNPKERFPSKTFTDDTMFFLFRGSQQLIDAFCKASDDHILWEPNMADYKKTTTKLLNMEKMVYVHKSLSDNIGLNIEDILPNSSKKHSDVCSIREDFHKSKDTLSDYIGSGENSIDYLFNEFDHDKKLYAYPLFFSQNYRKVMDRCIFSQYWKEGIYIKNDTIQPEKDCPNYLKHSLLCCGYSRFYTSYAIQEEIHIWYRFYNKRVKHFLYHLFTEIDDFEPFHSLLIEEEDIIGFVCCDVSDLDGGKESVLYMLTDEPLKYCRTNRFDKYDADYLDTYIESKYLNSNATKILTWSFIYEFQKQAGIDNRGRSLAINDCDKSSQLIDYIHSHYEQMNGIERDMCAYIIPDRYTLTPQESVKEECLHSYIVNLGSIIRTNGLVIAKTMPFFTESVPKQFDKVLDVIDKRKKSVLNPNIDCCYDLILILIVVNCCVQKPLRDLIGLWAYYHLINLRNRENSELTNELILFVYKNNPRLFCRLIAKIKTKEMVQQRVDKGWFHSRIVEDKTSWTNRDNDSCYFELFDIYSNSGKGYRLTDAEIEFFCERLRSEIENNSAEMYFKNNLDGNHTTLMIEKEKSFYINELENYVINRVGQNDFIFKEITLKD